MKKAAVHIPSSVMNLRNQKLKKERKKELLVLGGFKTFNIKAFFQRFCNFYKFTSAVLLLYWTHSFLILRTETAESEKRTFCRRLSSKPACLLKLTLFVWCGMKIYSLWCVFELIIRISINSSCCCKDLQHLLPTWTLHVLCYWIFFQLQTECLCAGF